MRAPPAGAVGARACGAGGDPALAAPARVVRLPRARPLLRPFPGAGRAGRRVPARALLEDRRGLGPAAAGPPVARLLLRCAVQVPDRRPARQRAVPDRAQPRAAGAGPVLPAALRGSLRVFAAVRHALLRVALLHAQVITCMLCKCGLQRGPPFRIVLQFHSPVDPFLRV